MKRNKSFSGSGVLFGAVFCVAACCASWRGAAAQETPDFKAAVQAYLPAANHGDVLAEAHLGNIYETATPPRMTEAVDWYRKAADQGLAYAQWRLALIYDPDKNNAYAADTGGAMKHDIAEALKWWLKAADQDYADAEVRVADLYYNGAENLKPDYPKAALWYRRLANQGNIDAPDKLGAMYEKGQGVAQNWTEAYFWYCLSTSCGESAAARQAATHLSNEQQQSVVGRVQGFTVSQPIDVQPPRIQLVNPAIAHWRSY